MVPALCGLSPQRVGCRARRLQRVPFRSRRLRLRRAGFAGLPRERSEAEGSWPRASYLEAKGSLFGAQLLGTLGAGARVRDPDGVPSRVTVVVASTEGAPSGVLV